MSEEERLIEEARRSREETQEAREEAGLEPDAEPTGPVPEDPLPDSGDDEPWAKTSSGDAE